MGIFDKIEISDWQEEEKKINPIEIFDSLNHKIGYEYLREVQASFLKEWWSKRDNKDTVGIMDTGSGKTLIGLLMLFSKMNEGVGPAVYLCPDNQLVNQVIEQAELYGIPVCEIVTAPQGKKQEIPLEFINSEAILVTTFEKIFNGLSIFGIRGIGSREIQEIGALLIDDAHSSIKKARKQSTFVIPSHNSMYSAIFALFEEDIEKQSYGAFQSIKKGERSVSRLVPYWAYKAKLKTLKKILISGRNQDNFDIFIPFNLISDYLDKADCFISSDAIEISPVKIPLDKVPSYSDAKHKFIMSATFNNASDLVTELGIEGTAILNPISVHNESSIGERLIISPERYSRDISNEEIKSLIKEYSRSTNVVVIVSNNAKASEWIEYGATLGDKKTIDSVMSNLRNSVGNLVVLLNRYDGIDLLGDMCHLLIIDGLPKGASVRDNTISQMRSNSPYTKKMIAQTIEQGLGRAVRSGSDYCVTLLLDTNLLNFVSNNNNRQFFSKVARAQLDMGIELSSDFMKEERNKEEALKEIQDTIGLVLSRNKKWIEFYKNKLKAMLGSYPDENKSNILGLAEKEYQLLSDYENNKFEAAVTSIRNDFSNNLGLSKADQGWYLQLGAHILNSYNESAANDMQIKAKEKNTDLLIPATPLYTKRTQSMTEQVSNVKKWINMFSNATDLRIAVESILTNLVYSPTIDSNIFEKAVLEIGEFLGYDSSRPEKEYNDGPDNLWTTKEFSFVIECKSKSINDRYSRENAEQLMHSEAWYNDSFFSGSTVSCIAFHKSNVLFQNVHVKDYYFSVNSTMLEKFKSKVNEFINALSTKNPSDWADTEIASLMHENFLLDRQFIQNFTIRFSYN
ncbi:DEAD/DEAH box helicase [Enterococcus faecalis]|uniref:DEAD/DEAH box helicase n=1 Tax=Enterococcus faecalis TaxID=1351 RepID=UPI001C297499|nr:DEAD/DEAH box helicase [Enterococcus faecalis]MCD5248842.1 DEAD/DEAH box helicase [Enterococcus faecalis]HAP3438454.1 DEAD/DEAH box helicase [Enterococcus faecalis]HBG9553647.1 DEAD/DEAH box helicase [Enterococcus faecalis]HBM7954446.1 DEAD/DEAH box helicase [Enterococcus faecalis]HBM7985851.1 DEAD/DEAH box helicase [Enterococcus faecalis]